MFKKIFVLLVLSVVSMAAWAEIDKKTKAEVTRPQKPKMEGKYEQLRWPYLMPDDDLEAIANPSEDIMNIEEGSAEDKLPSKMAGKEVKPKNAYERALISTKIRPEFNNRFVKIPGFIVPIDVTEDNLIKTFFLVPYFGACIHVPPPPPNQIIYASYEKGLDLKVLYDPVWMYGKLRTDKITNDLATAAYTLTVDKIKEFKPNDEY